MISLLVTVPAESSRMLWLLNFLESNALSSICIFLSDDAARVAVKRVSDESTLCSIQKRLHAWAKSNNYRIPVCRTALKNSASDSMELADGFEVSELGQWVEDSANARHVLHWGDV
ncbi:MAG: DsrE family protein [Pseudomonadota bacterium]